jgi:hypothetical protein
MSPANKRLCDAGGLSPLLRQAIQVQVIVAAAESLLPAAYRIRVMEFS